MNTPSSDERGTRRVSISTVIAVGFLMISLGISLVLLVRSQGSSSLIVPAHTATITPMAVAVSLTPDPLSTKSSTSTNPPESVTGAPESDGIIIGLTPVQGGDPGMADNLEAAIRQALEITPFGATVQFKGDVVIPSGVRPESLNLTTDMPGFDVLVTWGPVSEGLQEVWINMASEPDMASLDGNFNAWASMTPGDLAILVNPEGDLSFTAQIVLASLELRSGDIANAAERIRDLQTTNAEESTASNIAQQAVIQMMLSTTEAKNGQTINALQRASQSIRLSNESWMAHLNRGSVYLQLGDATSALSEFYFARDYAPDYWPVLYNRVLANAQLAHYDVALADAQTLQTLQPDAAWAANLVGVIQVRQGDLSAAREQFQAAAALAPDAEIPLLNLAITLGLQGDFEQSVATYDRLLDIAPNRSLYFLNQALMYQAQEKYPQAEYRLNRAIELDPGYLNAYLLRGDLHLQMEAYDRATNDAQLALVQNPESGHAYVILGEVALAAEDFESSKDAFTQAIELGYATADVYEARGWAWHQLRYTGFAVEDYQQALTLGLSDSQLLLRLGFALLDAGRYEDALDALLGAVNLGLDTPEAHAGLAIALDRNGKKDEADMEYQQALDQDSHYGDPEFLATQPMWASAVIQQAGIILTRIR